MVIPPGIYGLFPVGRSIATNWVVWGRKVRSYGFGYPILHGERVGATNRETTYINLYEFMSIDIAIYVHIYIYIQNPYIIMMIAIIMRWNHQPGIVHIYIDKLYNIV